MRLQNLLGVVSAILLVTLSGVAPAQPPTPSNDVKTENSQPSNSPGLSANLISGIAAGNAGQLGGAVNSFVQGGGGPSTGLDVKRFALSGKTGAAAAPGDKLWNAWGAFSRSNIAYNFAPLQSSGNVNVYLGGVDYTFDNNMVLGVAVALDRTNVNLDFSAGTLSGNGTTVSPYLGIAINKNLAFDATIGYGQTTIKTATAGVAGSTNDNRVLGALGLTYRNVIGAWSLTGRGAFLAVRDKFNGYSLTDNTFVPEATVNISQVRLVGEAAYTSGPVTPYVGLAYINNVRMPDQAPVGGVAAANDSDAWTPTVGLRFRFDNGIYGGIRYSSEQSRSEVKNNQFLFNLGIRF